MSNETIESAEVNETEAKSAIEFTTDLNLPVEVRQEILKKAEELKAQYKLRKIFIALVEGEGEDD